MDRLRDDIIKYKKGTLSPEQMHALEKKALADPFLAEALEGTENVSADELAADISEIEKKILRKKNSARGGLFTPLRIAAGVLLVGASVFIVYQFVPKAETIALKTESPKPENKEEDKPSGGNVVVDKNTESEKTKIESKKLNVESGGRKAKKESLIAPRIQKPTADGHHSEPLRQNPVTATQPTLQETPVQDLAAIEEQVEKAEAENDKTLKEKDVISSEPNVASGASTTSRSKKSDYAPGEAKRAAAPLAKFQASQSISGQVTSAEDNAPLPGVNVSVKGTSIGTVTDSKGNFTVSVSGPNQQLVFSFIGLQQQEVDVTDRNKVNVKMKEDATQLSEIVVTGYGAKKEDEAPVITVAEPVGGRKAYDKYLESNLKYPEEALKNRIKGKARIEFTVGTDGDLYDFKVIKKLGYGCEEEIIRLVKEGPKWIPSTEDNKPTESTVLIQMRFDPAKSGR